MYNTQEKILTWNEEARLSIAFIKNIAQILNIFKSLERKIIICYFILMQKLPPIVPRNPLQFVSCNIIFSFVPGRMLESELTSLIAATMAGFTDRPMTEFNVNRAPKLTTLGLG